jgi:hypothetical protein
MGFLCRRSLGKRGELIVEMAIKLIIFAIVLGAIVYVFIQFITPDDDRDRVKLEYHYDYLLSELDRAWEGKMSGFPVIHSIQKKMGDHLFYVVYFGSNAAFRYGEEPYFDGDSWQNGISFIMKGQQQENVMCVCSFSKEDNADCSFCEDIGRKAYLNGDESDIPWVLEIGDPFMIKFTGGVYVFDDR